MFMLGNVSDDSDPPRKFYQFKPKEFEQVNPPLARTPESSSPTDVRDHFQAANARPPPPPPAVRPVAATNDVQAMLRENLQHANAAGLNELTPQPRRRSRRTRDYWLVLVFINAILAFAAFGPYANGITLVYGIAGMIFLSTGLTWVMWFVMDDY
jgi:hypothetical protein